MSDHITEKWLFEVDCASQEKAFHLQTRIFELFRGTLKSELEEVLDRVEASFGPLRIDQLYLNFGDLDADTWEDDLQRKLPELLFEAIAREVEATGATLPTRSQSSSGGSKTELLLHFLQNGVLPWWATEQRPDMTLLLLEILNSEARFFLSGLVRLKNTVSAAIRLSKLVDETSFPVLVQQLEPSQAAFIIDFVSVAVKSHKKEPITSGSVDAFAKELRQLVVLDLVRNHGSTFNRKTFVKRQLLGLATSSGLSFEYVLSRFTQGLSSIDIPFSLRSTLPSLLLSIEQEESTGQVGAIDSEKKYGNSGLKPYLQGHSGDFTFRMLETFVEERPEQAIQGLLSLPPEGYLKPKLLEPFRKPAFVLLLNLLLPEQSDFVEDYSDQLIAIQEHRPFTSAGMRDYELLVWEVLLMDIMTEHGTLFNRKQFIKRTLEKIAFSQGLQFSALLQHFNSAIKGMKLPAYFRTTLAGLVYGLQVETERPETTQKRSDAEALDIIASVLKGAKKSSKKLFEKYWAYLVVERPQELKELLLELGKTNTGKDRLLKVLEEPSLVDVVEILQPAHAQLIVQHKLKMDAAHRQKPIVEAGQSDFSQAQWKIIVYYLLSDRGTRFNKKSFLKSMIYGLARQYGLGYSTILERLTEVVSEYRQDGSDGFVLLLNELKVEDHVQEQAREQLLQQVKSQSPKDLQELLMMYLSYGYIPWDAYFAFPELNLRAEVIKWLEDPQSWQWLVTDHPPEVIQLQRLVELVGLQHAATLLRCVMQAVYKSAPADQFIDSIDSVRPEHQREQERFYAELLHKVLSQENIDFEVILDHVQKEGSAIEKEGVLSSEYVLASLAQQFSSTSGASLSEEEIYSSLTFLESRPEQLKVFLKSLSESQILRLLETFSNKHLEQLVGSLFSRVEILLQLHKAFENQMAKSALWMVHSTKRKHWQASLLLLSKTTSFGSDKEWMQRWWQELLPMLKLPKEELQLVQKGISKTLSRSLRTVFDSVAKKSAGTVSISKEEGNDEYLLVFLNAGGVSSHEDASLLEGEWHSLLLRYPSKAFQLLGRMEPSNETLSHLAGNFRGLTKKAMLRVFFPTAHSWMLEWSTQMVVLLSDVRSMALLSHREREQLVWEALFALWYENSFVAGDRSQFLQAFLGVLSRRVDVKEQKLHEHIVAVLPQAKLPEGQKRSLKEAIEQIPMGSESEVVSPTHQPSKTQEQNQELESTEDEAAPKEGIFVENAGLILIGPYFGRLFDRLQLTQGGKFISEAHQEKAIRISQYLVDGHTDAVEYELPLNKFLCAWPIAKAMGAEVEVTETDKELCEGLLSAAIQNWSSIGNTSVQGFRESFLQREGKLARNEMHWQLTVQTKAFDILLDTLPWTYQTIKLPWMEELLEVDWR